MTIDSDTGSRRGGSYIKIRRRIVSEWKGKTETLVSQQG